MLHDFVAACCLRDFGVAGRTLGLLAGFCLTSVSAHLRMRVAQQLSSSRSPSPCALLPSLSPCLGGPQIGITHSGPTTVGAADGITCSGPRLAKAKGRVAAARAGEYSPAHPSLEEAVARVVAAARAGEYSPAHNPPPLALLQAALLGRLANTPMKRAREKAQA